MILKFRIDRQKITRLDDSFVVARSKNYLYAEFEFTDDWTGDIFAIFKNSNIIKPYSQKLVDNKCIVPWEVLQMPGTLTVSAFGGDLITANNVAVKIHDAGYDENAAESMTPTPEVYQQVIQELIEKVSENNDVKANTASRHSHDNKDLLDTISQDKVNEWDGKQDKDFIIRISPEALIFVGDSFSGTINCDVTAGEVVEKLNEGRNVHLIIDGSTFEVSSWGGEYVWFYLRDNEVTSCFNVHVNSTDGWSFNSFERTTLSDFNITDAYTKNEIEELIQTAICDSWEAEV